MSQKHTHEDYRKLGRDFLQLYNEQKLCDVTFKCSDGEVKAHKPILAARCPYFERMFCGPMKEKDQSVVELPEEKCQDLALILPFIYSGKILLTPENVVRTFTVADRYCFEALQAACLQFPVRTSNILELMQRCATAPSAEPLYKRAIKALKCEQVDCAEVIQNDRFATLPIEIVIDICKYCKIRVEEQLFRAVLRWAKAQVEKEHGDASPKLIKQYLRGVLEYVRFAQIPENILLTVVEPSNIVPRSLLLRTWKYHAAPFSLAPEYRRQMMPRHNTLSFEIPYEFRTGQRYDMWSEWQCLFDLSWCIRLSLQKGFLHCCLVLDEPHDIKVWMKMTIKGNNGLSQRNQTSVEDPFFFRSSADSWGFYWQDLTDEVLSAQYVQDGKLKVRVRFMFEPVALTVEQVQEEEDKELANSFGPARESEQGENDQWHRYH